MEYVLIGDDWVTCDTVEEGLKHTTSTSYERGVLFRLPLLDCIVTDRLLRRDWWDDQGGV